MSLSTHDPLGSSTDLDLPDAVVDVLVDLGLACNAAVVAITHAQTAELSAREAAVAVSATRRSLRWCQRTHGNIALSALTYADMLTAEYAVVAANYAVDAANVAADLLAGRQPQVPEAGRLLPSHVLANLDTSVPLIQIPPSRFDQEIAAGHNEQLVAFHSELVSVIRQRLPASATTDYDDIALAAHRQAGSTELVLEFPAALHGYASALTSMLQLVATA
ncbi:hypothetical protein [Rugosimonospora africana]|uniref:Uncharacterized protein n=1 Tax=Rugosimonospora africana TaxID=556532 RepID=A0A8J3VU80_9ACTN|nr:hypothetical protein [Rugosimonospora africana]GIH18970.1 hypothetical protein Raf01_71420 [Rugosimonospora africana]